MGPRAACAPVARLAHADPSECKGPHEQSPCGGAGSRQGASKSAADRVEAPANRQAHPDVNPEWLPGSATADAGAAETVCRVLRECSLVAAMHPDQARCLP